MKNGVMMQYFEWYLPNDGNLWNQLAGDAEHLAEIGVTSVWIPPAYKADEQADEGYATYDLYDLGEFDQKGSVRTKYGTRDELTRMIEALHNQGISVYLDVVMNHKAGGDYSETFHAIEVNPDNRNEDVGEEHEIESKTGYDFQGRGDKYSDFKWHWYHFSGVGYDERTQREGIFRITGEGKGWSQGVDTENVNYDYLLCNDIDLDSEEVRGELLRWGVWVARELGIDGIRMDAIKHMDYNFVNLFLDHLRSELGEDFYAVGEYWNSSVDVLSHYLEQTADRIELFDVSLHFNLHEASEREADYDMSQLLEGSLAVQNEGNAVTFVDNHDSQIGCSLESEIQPWFKPMAYALILLMKDGYPCIFYGDYYGVRGEESPHRQIIETLLHARHRYAFGEQTLVFDDHSVVALIRHGDQQHEGSGLVLVMSNNDAAVKELNLGPEHSNQQWTEITGSIHDDISTDENGLALFPVASRNISVWVRK